MTPASKRRDTDGAKLMRADFKLDIVNDDNMHEFFVEFHGPKDSLYHGYVWWLKVEMPIEYPYKPPVIRFANKIFHPNIHEESGSICINVLNKSWSYDTNLVPVFEHYIPQLLKFPNPGDPYNMDAAGLLLSDPATYRARVKDYCEWYATPEEPRSKEMNEDGIEEMSEDDLVSETQEKMRKLVIEQSDYDHASGDENVSGKAEMMILEEEGH